MTLCLRNISIHQAWHADEEFAGIHRRGEAAPRPYNRRSRPAACLRERFGRQAQSLRACLPPCGPEPSGDGPYDSRRQGGGPRSLSPRRRGAGTQFTLTWTPALRQAQGRLCARVTSAMTFVAIGGATKPMGTQDGLNRT